MPGPITFTLDLEDHRESSEQPERFPEITRSILDFLELRSVRGTFFVVGDVADRHPDLVREVASHGHEIGLHGWTHTPLTELDPERLRAEATRGKALLEDLAGRPVQGFRAPMFSLVTSSRWAVAVLADVGFEYSSSVLPARSPLFGDADLPRTPFRWPEGLLELPCPVLRAGPLGLPYLGGVYLRTLPGVIGRLARPLAGPPEMLWIYCHPYDFDPDEPFWVVPEAGRLGSRLLWYNRRRTFARIDALLRDPAPPLGERLGEVAPLPLAPALDPRTP